MDFRLLYDGPLPSNAGPQVKHSISQVKNSIRMKFSNAVTLDLRSSSAAEPPAPLTSTEHDHILCLLDGGAPADEGSLR